VKASKTLLALIASTMVAGMVFAEPADKPADDAKPAAPKKEAKPRPVRLIQPYSLIESSLTDEQKQKLNQIHQDFLAEQKKLREKEEADSMAVLTDDQKAEVKAALEKKAADDKEKKAKGGAEKAPAKAAEEKK
jgi:Spy/CpxP family protein refolding chaperone